MSWGRRTKCSSNDVTLDQTNVEALKILSLAMLSGCYDCFLRAVEPFSATEFPIMTIISISIPAQLNCSTERGHR